MHLMDDKAIAQLQVALPIAHLDLRQIENLITRILGRQFDRVARAVRCAGRNRLPFIRRMVGISRADCDFGRVDA